MSSSCEELIRLAEALTNETDTDKLIQVSKQLLNTLDRVEAEKNSAVRVE
jgi:hypothetical protein